MRKKEKSILTPCQEMKKNWQYSFIGLRRRYLKERYYHMFIAILHDRGIEWENANDYVVQSWNLAKHSLEHMYGLVKAWENEQVDFFKRDSKEALISSITTKIGELSNLIENESSLDQANEKFNETFKEIGVGLINTAEKNADKRYNDKIQAYPKSKEFVEAASELFLLWEIYRQNNCTPPTKEGFIEFLRNCQKTLDLKITDQQSDESKPVSPQ